MNARAGCVAIAAIVALTACGGGSGSSSLPSTPTKSAYANTNATMRLTIPAKSALVRAKYVSTSTQSVVLTVNGTALPAFGTTPSSPGCSANNGGTVCSLAFSASVGSATIGVKAYDAASGGGNLLSQGSVTQTLVAGTNVVPVIMGGVTASLAVSAAAISAGTAGTTPVIVQAKDADGNTIVGPGNYSTPVTVTDGDTSGITTLAVNGTAEGTSATVNSPNDVVALRYNGKNLVSATLTPSASGVSAITPGAFVPTVATTYFPLPAHVGNPFNPTNIAAGGDGNLWITAQGSPGAIFKMTTSGAVTEFDPGVAPSTALPNVYLQGIAGTPPGSAVAAWFVVGNSYSAAPQTVLGSITAGGVVTMYSVPSWCGGQRGAPQAIISDGQGGAWFTTVCLSTTTSNIEHVSSTGSIASTSVTFSFSGIAVGKDGNLYSVGCVALPCTSSSAAVLQAVVSGTTITGTNAFVTGVSNAGAPYSGIAQSDDGDFWMSDGNDTIARLHPAATLSNSVFTAYGMPGGFSFPGTALSGGNNTIWMGNNIGTASVTEIIPAANLGTPTQVTVPLTAPPGNQGNYVAGALGPDGFLYFVNDSNTSTQSGVIAKIAY